MGQYYLQTKSAKTYSRRLHFVSAPFKVLSAHRDCVLLSCTQVRHHFTSFQHQLLRSPLVNLSTSIFSLNSCANSESDDLSNYFILNFYSTYPKHRLRSQSLFLLIFAPKFLSALFHPAIRAPTYSTVRHFQARLSTISNHSFYTFSAQSANSLIFPTLPFLSCFSATQITVYVPIIDTLRPYFVISKKPFQLDISAPSQSIISLCELRLPTFSDR